MKHTTKVCSCGKQISTCRCPGPRRGDGTREPKTVETVQNGCSSCKHMKRRAPGDVAAMEQSKDLQAELARFEAERERKKREEEAKFQIFVDKVKGLGFTPSTQKFVGYSRGKQGWEKCDPYVETKWCTGGVTGGSCYDTGEEDNHRPIDGEPEPETDAFDLIIEKLAPTIGFMQYKIMRREIVVFDTETDNDYYGNYTNYSIKRLDLKKLYDALVEGKLYTP